MHISPEAVSAVEVLHDDVEVLPRGERVVEADDEGVVGEGEDVALVVHAVWEEEEEERESVGRSVGGRK